MRVAIGKAHDLVFDRRAVTWADPFDDPGIHRAAIEVIADHVMGFFIGMGDVARHLFWVLAGIAQEREYRHRRIAVLWRQYAEIDSAGVDARWRTGFQAVNAQRQFSQTLRQRD